MLARILCLEYTKENHASCILFICSAWVYLLYIELAFIVVYSGDTFDALDDIVCFFVGAFVAGTVCLKSEWIKYLYDYYVRSERCM